MHLNLSSEIPNNTSLGDEVSIRSIVSHYNMLEHPLKIAKLPEGRNIIYKVEDAKSKYILKSFRLNEIEYLDLKFEHELLAFLKLNRFPAAFPISFKPNASEVQTIIVQNDLYWVLYTYALGSAPLLDQRIAHIYGSTLANLHLALDNFSPQSKRPLIDEKFLIEEPLDSLRPFLANSKKRDAYLVNLGEKFKTWLKSLQRDQGKFGLCHGDFHHLNAHIDQSGILTLFDFEQAGDCWRTIDLATFIWGTLTNGGTTEIWDAFMKGYNQKRSLSMEEATSIRPFIAIRQMWWLGFHAINWGKWKRSWLTEDFFTKGVNLLNQIMDDLEIDDIVSTKTY